jgi:hypothetical protein
MVSSGFTAIVWGRQKPSPMAKKQIIFDLLPSATSLARHVNLSLIRAGYTSEINGVSTINVCANIICPRMMVSPSHKAYTALLQATTAKRQALKEKRYKAAKIDAAIHRYLDRQVLFNATSARAAGMYSNSYIDTKAIVESSRKTVTKTFTESLTRSVQSVPKYGELGAPTLPTLEVKVTSKPVTRLVPLRSTKSAGTANIKDRFTMSKELGSVAQQIRDLESREFQGWGDSSQLKFLRERLFALKHDLIVFK